MLTCTHTTCQTLRFANIKVLRAHESRFHKHDSVEPLVFQRLSLIQLLIEEPIRCVAELLHRGETIGLSLLDTSVLRKMGRNKKAAERAAKHRASKNSEEHKAAEASRKREQRADLKAETDRIAAIDDIVRANPDTPMTMTDGPKLATGGFSSQKIEKDLAATGASASNESLGNETTEEHRSGKRVKSRGTSDQQSERSGGRTESEDWFVESAFKRIRTPKEVAAMRRFIFDNTYTRNKVLCCLFCKSDLCTSTRDGEHIGICFNHFADVHPEKFKAFVEGLSGARCPEDHERYIRMFSGGDLPLVCRKCKKTLWKPPKVRTDADDDLNRNA
jgi:hypothetical protein